MAKTIRTIDVARAGKVSVQQVRNYEANGLIPPVERSATGYRLYTDMHVQAMLTVRQLIGGYGWVRTQQMMEAVHQGNLPKAVAIIDERHSELDRTRHQLEETLATLRVIANQLPPEMHSRLAQRLRVGAAAKMVGVQVSALRFWEQMGLLHPVREKESRYRLYDERQLRRLRIVALLRQANYDFDAIRTTLDELEAGQPRRAVAAVEQRRTDLARLSWHCVQGLSLFYAYVSEFWGGV